MTSAGEQVLLSGLTTLGLGGPARKFVAAGTEADLVAAVRAADDAGEPLLILGGGSNLVIADGGFPGTVVQVATAGVRAEPEPLGRARVTVAAGEDWDGLVARCGRHGLAGLECLSGIPGRTGATPIQNVGAYGQEVAETIATVRVYDRKAGEVTDLPAAECGFGYRTSSFKQDPSGRYVVLAVTFRLARGPRSSPVRYPELARALAVAEGEPAPLGAVRDAVLRLRRGKGMVLDPADPDSRSAGSFFTNPVLDTAQFTALRAAVTAHRGPDVAIPQFPAGPGQVKVPAAWLIGQAGFGKGYPGDPGRRPSRPHISGKHTLALVNPGGASTADLVALAREIRDRVRDLFGVTLAVEPVLVGVSVRPAWSGELPALVDAVRAGRQGEAEPIRRGGAREAEAPARVGVDHLPVRAGRPELARSAGAGGHLDLGAVRGAQGRHALAGHREGAVRADGPRLRGRAVAAAQGGRVPVPGEHPHVSHAPAAVADDRPGRRCS